MTKSDLMDNFDDIVTDPRLTRALCERHLEQSVEPYLLDEYHVVAMAVPVSNATSSSTGSAPGRIEVAARERRRSSVGCRCRV